MSSCGIEKLRSTVPVDFAADLATLRPSKQARVIDKRLPSGGPSMPSTFSSTTVTDVGILALPDGKPPARGAGDAPQWR
ncbi:hypothetical protein ACWCQS_23025 [Streptomyces sp. NPDC002076]